MVTFADISKDVVKYVILPWRRKMSIYDENTKLIRSLCNRSLIEPFNLHNDIDIKHVRIDFLGLGEQHQKMELLQ